jgi:hypothetical protein
MREPIMTRASCKSTDGSNVNDYYGVFLYAGSYNAISPKLSFFKGYFY